MPVDSPAVFVDAEAAAAAQADTQQAEYFLHALDVQRTHVNQELARHAARLAKHRIIGDTKAIRRSLRSIRHLQTEHNELDRLIAALEYRFPAVAARVGVPIRAPRC